MELEPCAGARRRAPGIVLSRRLDESIQIGEAIQITMVAIRSDHVRLGITAPREIPVHRQEVAERIARDRRADRARSRRCPGPDR
jgi:carbon storage regulator